MVEEGEGRTDGFGVHPGALLVFSGDGSHLMVIEVKS